MNTGLHHDEGKKIPPRLRKLVILESLELSYEFCVY